MAQNLSKIAVKQIDPPSLIKKPVIEVEKDNNVLKENEEDKEKDNNILKENEKYLKQFSINEDPSLIPTSMTLTTPKTAFQFLTGWRSLKHEDKKFCSYLLVRSYCISMV